MKLLSCLVLARQQTLGDRPFKSIEAVQQYGIDTYGALMKLLMRVLAQNRERMMHAIGKPFSVVINEEALEVVDLLAGAMALVTLLRLVVCSHKEEESGPSFRFWVARFCYLHLLV